MVRPGALHTWCTVRNAHCEPTATAARVFLTRDNHTHTQKKNTMSLIIKFDVTSQCHSSSVSLFQTLHNEVRKFSELSFRFLRSKFNLNFI